MRENPFTLEQIRTTSAYLTFVALDAQEHPTAIPPLEPQTPDEIRRYENGRLRVAARKELLQKLRPRS